MKPHFVMMAQYNAWANARVLAAAAQLSPAQFAAPANWRIVEHAPLLAAVEQGSRRTPTRGD